MSSAWFQKSTYECWKAMLKSSYKQTHTDSTSIAQPMKRTSSGRGKKKELVKQYHAQHVNLENLVTQELIQRNSVPSTMTTSTKPKLPKNEHTGHTGQTEEQHQATPQPFEVVTAEPVHLCQNCMQEVRVPADSLCQSCQQKTELHKLKEIFFSFGQQLPPPAPVSPLSTRSEHTSTM